jgi:NADH:ubiquinone oxidoreductase subunit 3 (subunit A)
LHATPADTLSLGPGREKTEQRTLLTPKSFTTPDEGRMTVDWNLIRIIVGKVSSLGARMETWFPVAVMIGFAALVVGGMVSANRILGPRRPSTIKGEAFECGNPPSGSAWGRFSVRFYLTAILFLVFDVEVVLLYPWAIAIRRLGMVGLAEAAIFITVLLIALIYAVRRGALDWD